jgi:hypothetical protein
MLANFRTFKTDAFLFYSILTFVFCSAEIMGIMKELAHDDEEILALVMV